MNRFVTKFVVGVTILASFFISPIAAFADTYGSGSFGGCSYNTGCTTSSSSNPIASAVSSAGSAITAFFCSNQAPSSAPNLYQIDVTSTTAKLYFAPSSGPVDRYYISYGPGNDSEGNGTETPATSNGGAMVFTVNLLSPSNVYTFKVRGGNGCKPGPWSNTLTIKTLTKGSKQVVKYYPNKQAKYVQAKRASWITQAQAYVSDHLPKAPKAGMGPVKTHKKTINATNSKSANTSPMGTITNWLSGFLH